MTHNKPVLMPAAVPWAVAASTSYLTLHRDDEGHPMVVTFVDYYRLNDDGHVPDDQRFQIVEDPGEFRLDASADDEPFRMTRLLLEGARAYRYNLANSEYQVISSSEFCWDEVPGCLRLGEDPLANLERTDRFWIERGISPDSGVYEVVRSPWLSEVASGDTCLRHYIIVDQNGYYDIAAQGWRWEAGQKS